MIYWLLTDLLSRFCTYCTSVMDVLHVRLNAFKHLFEFLCLQWDDLIVVADLLYVLDLFTFSLGFSAGDLLL